MFKPTIIKKGQVFEVSHAKLFETIRVHLVANEEFNLSNVLREYILRENKDRYLNAPDWGIIEQYKRDSLGGTLPKGFADYLIADNYANKLEALEVNNLYALLELETGRGFKVGDKVYWYDPDGGECSCEATVKEIKGDTITIEDDNNGIIGCYEHELELL
jgi:hypothetical protein